MPISKSYEKVKDDAVKLAVNLIKDHAGKFEPEKMPNEYARAVHELVQAKVEQRAPEVEIEPEKREEPKVINIMDALKKSMTARGQTKVRDAAAKRTGKISEASGLFAYAPRSRVLPPNRALVLTSANQFPTHFAA
jgi:DNA end-binding protein Ku